MSDKDAIHEALTKAGHEALKASGGFFIKGHGFKTIAWARKVTGITAPKRNGRERVSAWGDYATIAAINRGL